MSSGSGNKKLMIEYVGAWYLQEVMLLVERVTEAQRYAKMELRDMQDSKKRNIDLDEEENEDEGGMKKFKKNKMNNGEERREGGGMKGGKKGFKKKRK